jgi:anti-sigma regulatory factor (Ser/Thr protein kinase)
MRRRRFDRRPEEVAAARRFVGSGLARGSEAWETAQLLVSETVTSALDQSAPQTASGSLEVGYTVVGRRLRVEVSDDGGPARLRQRIQDVRSVKGRRAGVRQGPGQPLGGPRECGRADDLVRDRPHRRIAAQRSAVWRRARSGAAVVTPSVPRRPLGSEGRPAPSPVHLAMPPPYR